MRKSLILTFFAVLAMTMASCNWDPTDYGRGNDNGHKGDDHKNRDGMVVRGMEGDAFKTPCDFHFVIQSITVTQNTSDLPGEKVHRQVTVVIEVTNADGTTAAYTLTTDAPSVTIGDCTITLKGVEPHKKPNSDAPVFSATLAITHS